MVCEYDRDGKKDLFTGDENSGYFFFRNTGSDAAPVLAAAQAVTFNGQTANYVRPNLGSFLDWDGDGKWDLIACEFENNVRFYKNIGSGAAGQIPQYANVDGQFIAFDRAGQTVWQHRLGEEYGRGSGFGGRTLVPVVDEDRVIIGVVGGGWGDIGPLASWSLLSTLSSASRIGLSWAASSSARMSRTSRLRAARRGP